MAPVHARVDAVVEISSDKVDCARSAVRDHGARARADRAAGRRGTLRSGARRIEAATQGTRERALRHAAAESLGTPSREAADHVACGRGRGGRGGERGRRKGRGGGGRPLGRAEPGRRPRGSGAETGHRQSRGFASRVDARATGVLAAPGAAERPARRASRTPGIRRDAGRDAARRGAAAHSAGTLGCRRQAAARVWSAADAAKRRRRGAGHRGGSSPQRRVRGWVVGLCSRDRALTLLRRSPQGLGGPRRPRRRDATAGGGRGVARQAAA